VFVDVRFPSRILESIGKKSSLDFLFSLSNFLITVQWSVGTILMGLYSFMLEVSPTYGSIETSDLFKRKVARESLSYNCKNKLVFFFNLSFLKILCTYNT